MYCKYWESKELQGCICSTQGLSLAICLKFGRCQVFMSMLEVNGTQWLLMAEAHGWDFVYSGAECDQGDCYSLSS